MKKRGLVYGAVILTAANVITRIIGFIYRIYMSNVIGAEGMGLYQIIMPVYMLCWSISSSGFSTAVSKIVAAENAKKNYGNMGRVLKQSIFITTTIGILLGIILFSMADFISLHVIKDGRTILSLQILAFCFPFMAAGSCVRGYFHGLQEAAIPAVSQIFEQTFRMLAVYLLSTTLIPKGIEYACAAAVIGIVVGEIFSCLLVFLCYIRFKRKNKLFSKPTWGAIKSVSFLMTAAIPLTANRIASSLLAAVENVLIPQKLQAYGAGASQAMSEFGQLSGMAMPLIQFPSAILMALAISLVPVVSEATALKNKKKIAGTISKCFLFTTVVGIGATSVFLVFPYEIGAAIYHQQKVGELLFKISFLCPFIYMQMVMSGMLNGLGEQLYIFKINLLSSLMNIASTIIFVPMYGLNAYLITWFISIVITCFMCVHKVCKTLHLTFDLKNWIYKPIISAIAASLSIRYLALNFILPMIEAPLISVFICASFMMCFYMLFLIILGGISKNDIQMITKRLHLRGTP